MVMLLRMRFLRKIFYFKLLKSLLAKADKILDVGCGIGEFVQVAQNAGKSCVGVDVNLKSLTEAKQRSTFADYIHASMFYLPFRNHSFDAIFFSHVIEHVPISEAIPLLRTFREIGKLLVIITPSYHRGFWTPGHIVAYTPKVLEKVMKLAGYETLLVTYDKAFMLNVHANLFPSTLVKILNNIPIMRVKVNLLAIGISAS